MHPHMSSHVVPCRFISRFTRGNDLILSRGHLRNEKVRGSNPLSSTPADPGLTRPYASRVGESERCHRPGPPVVRPLFARVVQTGQSGPVSRRSQVVQIEICRCHRVGPHPGLHGHRIDAPSEPQARRRMAKIMNPPATRHPR